MVLAVGVRLILEEDILTPTIVDHRHGIQNAGLGDFGTLVSISSLLHEEVLHHLVHGRLDAVLESTQFSATWDATDSLQIKYIYGYNKLSYQRTTDDDNTASEFYDRQFYVNHEARYTSHELQAFYDLSDNLSFTSGIFFYDATIDQLSLIHI